MDYRICSGCGKSKPQREFWRYARRCRKCVARQARAKHREADTYLDWARHHRANPEAPFIGYRCDRCGRRNTGQEGCGPKNWLRISDEYDPAQTSGLESRRIKGLVCEGCGDAWEKARRNRPEELEPGLLVTPAVRAKLRRRAQIEIPRPARVVTADRLFALASASLLPVAIALAMVATNRYDAGAWSGWQAWTVFLAGTFGPFLLVGWVLNKWKEPAARAHQNSISAHVLTLAKIRQEVIRERQLFYTSAEWRQLRTQVIYELGSLCANCKQHIREEYDVCVDHIRPRSKYPHLALVKSNLLVLCRSCNARKGAQESELFGNAIGP